MQHPSLKCTLKCHFHIFYFFTQFIKFTHFFAQKIQSVHVKNLTYRNFHSIFINIIKISFSCKLHINRIRKKYIQCWCCQSFIFIFLTLLSQHSGLVNFSNKPIVSSKKIDKKLNINK